MAVTLPEVQVVLALFGEATTIPGGRLSVKLRLRALLPLSELSMVNVSVLRAPKAMVDGENDLVKPGRFVATVRSSVAVPLFPALEVRSPLRFV